MSMHDEGATPAKNRMVPTWRVALVALVLFASRVTYAETCSLVENAVNALLLVFAIERSTVALSTLRVPGPERVAFARAVAVTLPLGAATVWMLQTGLEIGARRAGGNLMPFHVSVYSAGVEGAMAKLAHAVVGMLMVLTCVGIYLPEVARRSTRGRVRGLLDERAIIGAFVFFTGYASGVIDRREFIRFGRRAVFDPYENFSWDFKLQHVVVGLVLSAVLARRCDASDVDAGSVVPTLGRTAMADWRTAAGLCVGLLAVVELCYAIVGSLV